MQIVIDIPNKDIQKHQEVIDIRLHFIDGHIVDADGYGFMELPKDHGRLIDAGALPLNAIDDANHGSNYIKIASTIIEADTESEE